MTACVSSCSAADSVAWQPRATWSEALRGHTGVEITLVSRENFFVITPLLFEACSGRLELRHCAQPIRAALRRARFVEATVESVDVAAPDRSSRRRRGSHVRPAVRPSRRGARRIHERAADPWLIERIHVQDDGGCAGAQESPDRTIRASRRSLRASDASRLPHSRRDRRRPRRSGAAGRAHGIRG